MISPRLWGRASAEFNLENMTWQTGNKEAAAKLLSFVLEQHKMNWQWKYNTLQS